MTDRDRAYLLKEAQRTLDGSDSTAAFCLCQRWILKDTIALLKEREPKPIDYKENRLTGLPVAICPNCGRFARQFHTEHPGEETNFCPWCGQAVKWEE